MILGIIFDLDGVLLSTDKFHYEAWKQMADKEGIYFDAEINNRLRGVSRMESLEIILEKAHKTYSTAEKEALATMKNELYVQSLQKLNSSFIDNDVTTTLEALKKRGLKLAIGSSSKNAYAILETTGLLKYFDCIADGTKIKNSKPHPEVFLLAKDLLGLQTEECLVVEDAISGIDAAIAGGFLTVGINDAKGYEKTNYPITAFKELIDIVTRKQTSIRLEHVKKVYPNGLCAVKDFTLQINPEEFVVFVGPSGCGKSTVLRMIAGLEEITEGKLFINGELVNDFDPTERDLAMVFQNYALYPHLSVLDNIIFPLAVKKIPFKQRFNFAYRKKRKQDLKEIGYAIAKKINLTEYLDTKPKNLSGGQRQRVALGRAIIRNPKAFLLDEPLSNLDAKMRGVMRTELAKLHNELKAIFIYVTHDQVEAMTMGDKIVVLKDGYIEQIAKPLELYLNPANKFVAGFIGTPQMNFFDCYILKKGKQLIAKINNEIEVSIPESIANKIDEKYLNQAVILGLRPKAVSISEQGDITGIVKLTEQLGSEQLIYFSIPGDSKEYVASTESYATMKEKAKISISLNMENACFFDCETEESITYEKT